MNLANNLWDILGYALFVISVISGIGPQNLNIISHCIKRNHEILVASTCFLSDITLIIFGFVILNVSHSDIIIRVINILGIAFLSWYFFIKIKNLFAKRSLYSAENSILTPVKAILRATALTWFNPLVLIDTIVVIDGNIMQHNNVSHIKFLCGAILGDFLWIYGLMLLVRMFSHKLNKLWVWLCLDIMTIIIISVILYKTILYVVY